MEYYGSLQTSSNGDLWPNCWADDGAIYAANGDGTGFDLSAAEADTVVNRIDGNLSVGIIGVRLAAAAQLGPIWGDSSRYNRKPTGMTCVDGVLYLAMQDLKYGTGAFDESPVASISRSDDHGSTWTPTSSPMFPDSRFSTLFFLDFGQDYGRRGGAGGPDNLSVISQGGVVYNAPLRRYLYTSWSEYTFEFYEAAAPWGPWRLFLHHDAGCYPWFGQPSGAQADPGPKNGGYGTTIPSKFISSDGLTMWVQSNWQGNGIGTTNYEFCLRRLQVSPARPSGARREPAAQNLAAADGVGVLRLTRTSGRTPGKARAADARPTGQQVGTRVEAGGRWAP